jgi:cyclomaltodextrinase
LFDPARASNIDTPDWVRDAVFYQILPDRFASSSRVPKPGPLEAWDAPPTIHGFKGGDLLGIVERLPYLADLGINGLYLTPIFSSAANHRYHTYDYLEVDPLLGGDGALRELLDAAHHRGMHVVLDGVFNHTGRGFWPFHHVVENGLDSPYADWFHLDREWLAGNRGVNAYPDRSGGGPATDGQGRYGRLGYEAWWGLPALPKLNTDNQFVREHLLSVAEHWLRFGIDGWRLDVPEEIADPGFWRDFRRRCRAVRADAYLVGEIWREAPEWLIGDRFDALMNYPLAEAILGYSAGEHLDHSVLDFHPEYRRTVRRLNGAEFALELERAMLRYDPAVTAVQLNLVGSHDTPRFLTLAGGDRDSLRLATFLQATLPGAPCIYYGDEIGLEGGRDPDNRRTFPVDDEARDEGLHGFVRAALRLRSESALLRRGRLRLLATGAGALAFIRDAADETTAFLVATNAEAGPARLIIDDGSIADRRARALGLPDWPVPVIEPMTGGGWTLTIQGRSGALIELG